MNDFLFYLPKGSENMERVTDTPNTIEVFENDIAFYMMQFMEENNIENLRDISQNVWNGMLLYVQRHVFKGTDKLRKKENIDDSSCLPSNCNAYDIDKLNDLSDYYILLCNQYDKEVSIMGFSTLTGIDADTIYQWNNDRSLIQKGVIIYKKLSKEREESLSAKLVTGKQNPVGVLGVLNRHYQWNMPGVTREQSSRQALAAADLPRLGNSRKSDGDNIIDVDVIDK